MSDSEPQTVDELPTSSVSLGKLAETSPVAITKVDKKGEIVYANSKAEEVFGLEKSEIIDRTYDDFDWKITYYNGTGYPSEKLPFEIVKETEEPVENVRYAIEWPDGERKLLSINASPLFDDEGDFDGMVRVIEDVTELISLEQREDHLTSLISSIRGVNQLLVKEDDRDKLIERICDILIKTRDYYNVWVALLDEDEELITASQSGLDDSFEPILDRLEGGNFPETIRQALDQPGVVVTNDPQDTCSDCPLRQFEDRGSLTARLAYQGKVYGVISASTPIQYAEDEEEQGLFEEVAGDIGFGLHNIEVENDLKKREAQLTRSQQLAKVGSWRIDLETGSLDWSEETYRIFDVPVNESLTYDEFLEFIHPEDREYVNEEWNEALENDKEYEVEHRIVVNGDIKWVKEKAGVIRNQQGEPREVIGSVQDITEYKETERELRENETKFKSIFSQSPIGIELYNQEGRLLEANQACLDLFGVKEVSEIKDFQLFEDPNLPDSAKEKLESGEQIGYETTFDFDKVRENDLYDTQKEGTSEIHVTATPITPHADIPFGGYLVQIQDITKLRKQEQQLRRSFIELAETTSRVLGVRDPYTQKHEQRVAELARYVGKKMGLDKDKLLGLYIGGVLHDIGKIAVPETILTKPGELKDVEWQMIKSHPRVGYNQILKDTHFPWPVAEMTLHHHERLDGSGYPDGLEGEELTTEVRILAAVDVVEAMSTRRPYREARSKETTLDVIQNGKGDKFDPEVVDILVEMIEESEIEFGMTS